jgi:hypothetical protein
MMPTINYKIPLVAYHRKWLWTYGVVGQFTVNELYVMADLLCK